MIDRRLDIGKKIQSLIRKFFLVVITKNIDEGLKEISARLSQGELIKSAKLII